MNWNIFKRAPRRIHLDFASTTPVHPSVFVAMEPYFSHVWANPSALYKEGVTARAVIDNARTELAQVLRVRAEDVTFTSGGTEANNLALIGVVEAYQKKGTQYEEMEIITTRMEHPSILETLAYLASRGVVVKYAEVNTEGLIEVSSFEKLLTTKTILCTFAYVNSEIGVIQDIKKITRIVRKWNETHGVRVYVHTDASQAPLWLPCALDALGADLMTLDAGKCYGPKGVGVLVHRHWVELAPASFGGGQESGLRSGTENTPLIVGCVRAIVRAQESWQSRSEAVAMLRDRFIALLCEAIPESIVNGSIASRVANNVNISIPELDTEYAVIWLDARGVAASTRSACGGDDGMGSHVVREMTKDDARSMSTIRFTLGEETTVRDISYAVQVLKEHVVFVRESNVSAIEKI